MSDGGHGGGHGGKRRGGHDEEHEEHENHERWLVSYADMMTLLMVLFIVMFAISQVDSKKFMALKTGLTSGFGAPVAILDGADALLSTGAKVGEESENLAGVAGNTVPDPARKAAKNAARVDPEVTAQQVAQLVNATQQAQVKSEVDSLKKAEAEIQAALAKAGLAKSVSYRFDERGLIVSIATDKVTFASGDATLLPAGRRILDAVAPTLRTLPNRISVDGHTDSRPISTAQFPSNWELSSARATGVLRYLGGADKIAWSRMVASGFADTKPLKPGASEAALAANRRVEIVILARIDNGAGRALATLGNETATGTAGDAASGSNPGTSADASASASHPASSASPKASETPKPSPSHNLLGPDPTPSAGG